MSASPERSSSAGLVRGLGPIATTALVAGNIIASGIFVIPASLAEIAGPLSLVAWALVAVGYLSLTVVYADLAGALPVSGGLQVYVQRAFGDLAGFLTAFLYWISCVVGNAAFITAFVGYCAVFVPAFGRSLPAFLLAQAMLWLVTGINIVGVRTVGAVQVVTTILKIAPLLMVAIMLCWSGSPANLVPFAPHGFGALFPAMTLVAWLFIGAESATVPAEEVVGEGRTIKRAAYAGYGLTSIVYLFVAFAVVFGLPSAMIAGSASPLADAALRVIGPWGQRFVTIGALISIAGALNGWILVAGRLPFAAARQRLGPAFLGRVSPRTGTPVPALLVNAFLTGLFILLYFNGTLLEAYQFIALASTSTALVAIGAACVAEIALVRREPRLFTPRQRRWGPWTALVGLAAVLVLIAGAGAWVGFLTVCAVLVPIPFFFLLRSAPG